VRLHELLLTGDALSGRPSGPAPARQNVAFILYRQLIQVLHARLALCACVDASALQLAAELRQRRAAENAWHDDALRDTGMLGAALARMRRNTSGVFGDVHRIPRAAGASPDQRRLTGAPGAPRACR
jgi:hypothetical protein